MKRVSVVMGSLIVMALVLFACGDVGNDPGDVATDGTLTVTCTGGDGEAVFRLPLDGLRVASAAAMTDAYILKKPQYYIPVVTTDTFYTLTVKVYEKNADIDSDELLAIIKSDDVYDVWDNSDWFDSFVLEEPGVDGDPSGTEWVGTAGTAYDVYIWVYVEPDDDYLYDGGSLVPVQYTQDGDKIISIEASDYS